VHGDPASSSEQLQLTPDVEAPARARAWIGEVLADWPSAKVADAKLLLSELVTNAVLHAQTIIEICVEHSRERVRVEVVDHLRLAPVAKHYGSQASTGRGMQLVTVLATECGTKALAGAKCVWFELAADDPGPAPETGSAEPDLSRWPHLDPTPPADGSRPGRALVRLLELPLAVYLAAEEHNDALLREFALLGRAEPGRGMPSRLLQLAAEVRAWFGPATGFLRDQVQAAIDRGAPTVDLDIWIPEAGWEILVRMSEQLDEVDEYCRAGDLLTLTAPPPVVRFRRWSTEQVSAQMAGRPPQAWPFPDRRAR
jgi:anti-sigma regulatory factor (Ser/Thr protein kinase)